MITHNGRKMHCLQNLCGCWQVAIFQFSVSLIYIYYVFLRAFFFFLQYLAWNKIAVSFTRERARDKEIPIEPKTDKWASASQASKEKLLPDVALGFIPSHQLKPQYVWIRGPYSNKDQFSLSNIFWSVTWHCIVLRVTWHETTSRYMTAYDIGK